MSTEFFSQLPQVGLPIQMNDLLVGVRGTADLLFPANQFGGVQPTNANVTCYVATTGSDNNQGTTPGSPFATLQHALNFLAGFDYMETFIPTVNVANGTYHVSNGIALPEFKGLIPNAGLNTAQPENGCQIIGNISTPSSVIIDFGGMAGIDANNNSSFAMRGFQLQNANDIIWISGNSILNLDSMIFDIRSGNFNVCNISKSGQVTFGFAFGGFPPNSFNIVIQGSAATFIFFAQNNALMTDLGCNWTISNPIATNSVASAGNNSVILWGNGGTLTGGSNLSGKQYLLGDSGSYQVFFTTTNDRSNLPGTAVGSVGTANRPGAVQTNNTGFTYEKHIPTSGSTVNILAGNQEVILVPAGTLATLTVNLPAYMADGEIVEVGTTQAITSLTVGAQQTFSTTTPTVVSAPTTLAAGGSFRMIFDMPDNKWYPI